MPTRKRKVVGPSLEIDKTVRNVGRIRHASGFYARAQLTACREMINEYARTPEGREILKLMVGKHPRLRADEFFVRATAGTLHLVTIGAAATPLLPALRTWREDYKARVAPDTYRTRHELLTNVERYARRNAMVGDLPEVMRTLHRKMAGGRQFNMMLQYARAFVRDTLGRRNNIYLDVADIPLRDAKQKRKKRQMSPREILALAKAFDVVRERRIAKSTAKRGVRPIEAKGTDVLVMAMTGMNPKEHAGLWVVYDHHIHVMGTKTEHRDRTIPKCFPNALWPSKELPRPSVSPKTFWRHFHAACKVAGVKARPYDMRHTFARWMADAVLDPSRREQYMGHGEQTMTEHYERGDVLHPHLVADGELLRNWINAQMEAES